MPKTHLNNTQRKVVRKYLARKEQCNEKIPYSKLIQQQVFREIPIQDLKKLFKNEELCIQDEQRRKEVIARKKMENQMKKQEQDLKCKVTRDKTKGQEEARRLEQHQVKDDKSPKKQADEENFQTLVTEFIRKDKQLKEYEHVIEKQNLHIQKLDIRCQMSFEMSCQTEERKRELEEECSRAQKDREYFKKCTIEWQREYERLEITLSRGPKERDYWELSDKLKSCQFKLDSLSFATSVEREVFEIIRILRQIRPSVRQRGWLTMSEMRDLIIQEGNDLKNQGLIYYFDSDEMMRSSVWST